MNTTGQNAADDRYDDPFVRLLELYVLKVINAISKEDEAQLKEITPRLQEIYDHRGNWQQIVEHVMEFPNEAREEIRQLWQEQKQEVAQTEGRRLKPNEFAATFADEMWRD